MKFTLEAGTRVRIDGMMGAFVFERLVVRGDGIPLAVVTGPDESRREVPVDRIRSLRKGRRRKVVA